MGRERKSDTRRSLEDAAFKESLLRNTTMASSAWGRLLSTSVADKVLRLASCGALATTAFVGLSEDSLVSADEAEHGLHSVQYPWPHNGIFSSYDHASIRRGHQVYQQVCAACHSVSLLHYRDLVGVAYTEEECKLMAEDAEVVDGPDDTGEK